MNIDLIRDFESNLKTSCESAGFYNFREQDDYYLINVRAVDQNDFNIKANLIFDNERMNKYNLNDFICEVNGSKSDIYTLWIYKSYQVIAIKNKAG